MSTIQLTGMGNGSKVNIELQVARKYICSINNLNQVTDLSREMATKYVLFRKKVCFKIDMEKVLIVFIQPLFHIHLFITWFLDIPCS